jgi:PAS domain S-box-containing protein
MALRESEERLRLALESAAQGLWDLNIQTDEAIVSPEYATMLGYDPEGFRETNSAWRERLHPDDRDDATAAYLDYVAGRRSTYSTEFRQRTKSGEWKWILSIGKIMSRTPDGQPLRMLGTHTDITARKLAELRSERLAELYEALSTCNFAVAHCTDQNDLFERVSAAAAGIGGVATAWIGLADPVTHRVMRVAAHGAGPAAAEWLDVSTEDIPIGRGPTGTAIREDRPCWILDPDTSPGAAPWRAIARQHGWVAAGSFPLRCEGRAIGALTIYANMPEAFDDDSRRLLLEISTGVSSALDHFARERRRTAGEEALRESESRYRTALQEREALLKEVHHRVKNNLQVISSLLRLERERHDDASVKSAMGDMQLRILSMALLHETLYQSTDLARVDLGAYLADLAGQVFRSSAPSNGAISLQLNLASLRVDIDDAVPCGLVVNEILSNCLKHAFPDGRGGRVAIELQPTGDGPEYRLRISDTGVGLPEDFETRRSGSLGVHLIRVLARQLKGALTIERRPGTAFNISFTPSSTCSSDRAAS